MVKDRNTEKVIFDAARRVFLSKGMAAARMQEIADEAGINKALLHYYFRNKEKLFEGIFNEVFIQLGSGIKALLESEMSVMERLKMLVDLYVDTLLQNRYLPLFVLNEMNVRPEKFSELINKSIAIHLAGFLQQVVEEGEKGNIRKIDPRHLLLNVLGMIIFPFAAYPLLKSVFLHQVETDFDDFLVSRKTAIYEFIENALNPKS
jgi:TetR/AcrR family transcriptional regulator